MQLNQKLLTCSLAVTALVTFVGATSNVRSFGPPHHHPHPVARPRPGQLMLDPVAQSKFVNELTIPPMAKPEPCGADHGNECDNDHYIINMTQFKQDLGLRDPVTRAPLLTTVWGYNGTFPGPTIEAHRFRPVTVKWVNNLPTKHLLPLDLTLHGAKGQPEVRSVVHLHGAEVDSSSDGYPEHWYTSDPKAKPNGMGGPAGNSATYTYPNDQLATMLWYHDHSLGITRQNVYSGLTGLYVIRDSEEENRLPLPRGKYEIPLLIQDRMFNADGSLFYPDMGDNPELHPTWVPEFFGDTILVNGKAWPYLKVEPRKYRFRVVNGSNARFYNMRLSNGQSFQQVGTDGGLLRVPVSTSTLMLAPAERADLVIDFAGLAPGTKITLTNDANAPFPDGDAADPATTGQIMQFVVGHSVSVDESSVPDHLAEIPALSTSSPTVRRLTLNEAEGMGGPTFSTLSNTMWDMPITETPKLGSTEIWEIINMTGDTHPIHVHLVEFQILNRQEIDADGYINAYAAANPGVPNGMGGKIIAPDPFLIGNPVPPDPNEAGWKDVVRVKAGTVTRIVAKFGPFRTVDPTKGNYVWHCHILEHEDNDMMRPMKILPN